MQPPLPVSELRLWLQDGERQFLPAPCDPVSALRAQNLPSPSMQSMQNPPLASFPRQGDGRAARRKMSMQISLPWAGWAVQALCSPLKCNVWVAAGEGGAVTSSHLRSFKICLGWGLFLPLSTGTREN